MVKNVTILIVISLSTTGCVQIGQAARTNPARIASRDTPDNCRYISGVGSDFKFAINLDCFTFEKNFNSSNSLGNYAGDYSGSIDESVYTAYSLAKGNINYRNRLQNVLISQADANCEKEKGHIFANEAGVGLAFNILSSGLDAASTIVTGTQAKTILSGIAGFSTASRSHVTANIYKNQIVPAITNMMDAERQKILNELNTKQGLTIYKYSADEMIRKVNYYNQACSFQLGIQLLLKASQNKSGTDAIIHSININHAISDLMTLKQSISDPQKRAEIDAKILEFGMERAETVQAVKGDTNTSTNSTDESSGSSDTAE